MALIKCPECGKEISDRTKACPYCAYPIVKLNENNTVAQKELHNTETKKHIDNSSETDNTKSLEEELRAREERRRKRQEAARIKKRKARRKKIIIISCIVVVLIAIAVFFIFDIPANLKPSDSITTKEKSEYFSPIDETVELEMPPIETVEPEPISADELKQMYLDTVPIYAVKANIEEYSEKNLIDIVYKNVSDKHGMNFKYRVIPYDIDLVPLESASLGTDDTTIKSNTTGGGEDGGVFIPKATKNAVVIVFEIEFTDGSIWEFEYASELIDAYEREIESNDPLLIPLTFVY